MSSKSPYHRAAGRLVLSALALLIVWSLERPVLAQTERRGITEEPAPVELAPSATSQKRALLIGVGSYYDTALNPLPNAVNDTWALRDALVQAPNGFPEQNVVTMTNDAPALERRPTRSNILAVFETWIERAGPEDTFLLFFAGHGVVSGGSLYLMPGDGRMTLVEDTGIAYTEIESKMKALRIKRSVVVLDTCHSGGGRGIAEEMTADMAKDIEEHSHVQLTFASCKVNERSYEFPEKKHSVFTWFLLEGMKGAADTDHNGSVSLSELTTYTTEAVRQWAKAKGMDQTPRAWGSLSGDLILGGVPPAGKRPTPLPHASIDEALPPEASGGLPFEPRIVSIPEGAFSTGTTDTQAEYAMELAKRYGSPNVKRKWITSEESSAPASVKTFGIGKYEVTNREYKAFVDATGYRTPKNDARKFDNPGIDFWKGAGYPPDRADDPVVNVSYRDTLEYCAWLGKQTGKHYRLPTETEWEYAAKSGKSVMFPWGDKWKQLECNAGVYLWDSDFFDGDDSDGYLITAPVYFLKSNGFGLYQMSGNVAEWCTPNDAGNTVVRGGSWASTPWGLRCANRLFIDGGTRSIKIGFRVARDY